MNRKATAAAGVSVLLAPILIAVGDQFRMLATASEEAGNLQEWGVEQAMADFLAIDAHRGAYETASWIFYAAAVMTIPALLVVWRLAVHRSPRWAWAGVALGVCSVAGQFVHLMGHFGANQVFSAQEDLEGAAQLLVDWEGNVFSMAVFAPYLIGLLFAPMVQAISLKRARVIPWWALVAVVVGSVLFAVLGSTPVVSTIWAVLLVAGFAPAAALAIRGRNEEAEPARVEQSMQVV